MPWSFSPRALLGCVLLVLSACEPLKDNETKPPDVLLIVLDAAAAPHFGLYGYERDTTPNLDALAADAHVWDRAYSQAPQTTNSISSLFTGRYPPDAMRGRKVSGESLAHQLRTSGFKTVAVVENPWFAWNFGFEAGFDEFHVLDAGHGPGVFGLKEEQPSKLLNWARYALTEGDRPLFLYLHILAPHSPYSPPGPTAKRFRAVDEQRPTDQMVRCSLGLVDPKVRGEAHLCVPTRFTTSELPEDERQRLVDRYDENLAFADALVGDLISWLDRHGRLDRTLIIVTSDHGEAFGQHGQFRHSTSLFDEQIRVPLIIRLPEILRSGRPQAKRHLGPAEIVDIGATVRDLLNIETDADPKVTSRSLFGAEATDVHARSFLGNGVTAVINDRYKLISGPEGSVALYDLSGDPGETRNIAREQEAVAAELGRELPADQGSIKAPALDSVSAEIRQKLNLLGYAE